MRLEIKPLGEFIGKKSTLKRIPEGMLPLAEKPVPWTGYLAFDDDTLIGMCAFKDVPDNKRLVEISCHTFPEFECRGYATAMARGLLEIATQAGEVKGVLAHTLRKENASARICRRLGFQCKGEVVDPEDGLVWRWHIQV